MFAGRDGYGLPYVLVQFPYDHRVVELIKELDHYDREWCPGPKLWKIKSGLAADILRTQLLRLGYDVAVHDPEEIIWERVKAPTTASPDWAEAMFQALPVGLHTAAYRALLGVLHPDRAEDGGSEPMKTLNAARDRVALERR